MTMYKIINGNLHIPSNSLTPNHRDSRSGYFTQLQTRTDSYKFSFFPSTILSSVWNSLPPSVINLINLSVINLSVINLSVINPKLLRR